MNRAILAVVLFVPALLLAVPLQQVTIRPTEDQVEALPASVVPAVPDKAADGSGFVIGAVDTIGGTTHDWQMTGPVLRLLVNSPGVGIHAVFMYSASPLTTYADRNMRYNFYDKRLATPEWIWMDDDFMQSGVNVFLVRTGFGSLDVDPATNAAVVSSHYYTTGSTYSPIVARDAEPGTGFFDFLEGNPTIDNHSWPCVAVGMNSDIHLAMIAEPAMTNLFWSKSTDFTTWSAPLSIPPPKPEPGLADQNITTSKVAGSQKLVIAWEKTGNTEPCPAFYRLSTDGGTTWESPVELSKPPAYGGDTVTSFHSSAMFPFFDNNDELHFAVDVAPFVGGTGYISPAQIWHWSESNSPNWSHIQTAAYHPTSPDAHVGYNALYACRPSLGQDQNGNLFVTWEQFDSSNIEPGPPQRLRADIFWSHSSDNGQTWAAAQKITDGGSVSYRFPCILDRIEDTVMVLYEIDKRAGFAMYNEPQSTMPTNNPIVVQKWANPYGGGIKASPRVEPLRMTASAAPNPFGRKTRIVYEVPRAGNVSLAVYDVAGRPVSVLASGVMEPGRHSVVWDGRDTNGAGLPAGVYMYKYVLGRDCVTGKLMLAD